MKRATAQALPPSEVNVQIVQHDPALAAIVGPNPKIFKLAEIFKSVYPGQLLTPRFIAVLGEAEQVANRFNGFPHPTP